jgi:hypothetical protein
MTINNDNILDRINIFFLLINNTDWPVARRAWRQQSKTLRQPTVFLKLLSFVLEKIYVTSQQFRSAPLYKTQAFASPIPLLVSRLFVENWRVRSGNWNSFAPTWSLREPRVVPKRC